MAYPKIVVELGIHLGIGWKIKYPDKTVAGWMGSRVGGMLFKRNFLISSKSLRLSPTLFPAKRLLLPVNSIDLNPRHFAHSQSLFLSTKVGNCQDVPQ